MRKIRALFWEQWRQVRLVIGLALALAVLVDQLMWLQGGTGLGFFPPFFGFNQLVDEAILALMGGLTLALLLAGNSPYDLQCGFQRRLYCLPLKSWKLVAIIGLTRLVLMTVSCGMLLGMHNLYWGDKTGLPLWIPLPIILLYILFQSISWSFGTYGWKTAMAAAIVALVAVVMLVRMTSIPAELNNFGHLNDVMETYPSDDWMPLQKQVRVQEIHLLVEILLLVPPLCLLAYIISLIGIRLDRRGTWLGTGGWRVNLTRLTGATSTSVNAQKRTFSSPEKAQLWFEWRRGGRIFLSILILFMLFFSVGFATLTDIGVRDEQELVFEKLFLAMACAAFVMGMLMFAMDHRNSISGVANFVAVRPMRSQLLARARLRSGFRMINIATAIAIMVGIGYLAWRAATIAPSYFLMPLDGFRDLSEFALMMVLASWTLLWVGTRLAAILLVLLAVIPEIIGFIADDFALSFPENGEDFFALYAMVVCIALTVWTFIRAHREGLVRGYWALPASISLAGFFLLWQSILSSRPLDHEEQLWLIGLLALPIAPFAAVPLDIHRRRSAHGGIL